MEFIQRIFQHIWNLGALLPDSDSMPRKRLHTHSWDEDTLTEPPYKRSRIKDFEDITYQGNYFTKGGTDASLLLKRPSQSNRVPGRNAFYDSESVFGPNRSNSNGFMSSSDNILNLRRNKENLQRMDNFNRQSSDTKDIQYLGCATGTPTPLSPKLCTSPVDPLFRFSPKVTSTITRDQHVPHTSKACRSFNFPMFKSGQVLSKRRPTCGFKPMKSWRVDRFHPLNKSLLTGHECVKLDEKNLYKQLLQQYTSCNLANFGFRKSSSQLFSNGKAMAHGSAVVKTRLDKSYCTERRKMLEQHEKNGTLFPVDLTEDVNSKNPSNIPLIDVESEESNDILEDGADDDVTIIKVIQPLKKDRNALENKLLTSEYYSYEMLQSLKANRQETDQSYQKDLLKAESDQKKSEEMRIQLYHENLDNSVLKRLSLLDLNFPQKVIEISEEEEEKLAVLTPEMERAIVRAFKGGPPNEVLADRFNLKITRQDIHTLAGLNWLNDEVINFYMNMIMERSNKEKKYPTVYAFNTFFFSKLIKSGYSSVRRWTKKVDIFSHKILLVPVHLGMHWCLAVVDFRSNSIRYYDSMLGDNFKCLKALRVYLESEYKDKKNAPYDGSCLSAENVKDIPQQMNGSDCGMFSCKFAENLSRDALIRFSQEHMPYFRRRMVYEIITQRLM